MARSDFEEKKDIQGRQTDWMKKQMEQIAVQDQAGGVHIHSGGVNVEEASAGNGIATAHSFNRMLTAVATANPLQRKQVMEDMKAASNHMSTTRRLHARRHLDE